MPENETPEMKAERWFATIKPYLDELSQPKPDYAFLAKARAKNPFLDWVMQMAHIRITTKPLRGQGFAWALIQLPAVR